MHIPAFHSQKSKRQSLRELLLHFILNYISDLYYLRFVFEAMLLFLFDGLITLFSLVVFISEILVLGMSILPMPTGARGRV